MRPDRPVSCNIREPLWKSHEAASPPSPPRPPVTTHLCLPRDMECPETDTTPSFCSNRPSHDCVLQVAAQPATSLSVSTAPACRTPRRSSARTRPSRLSGERCRAPESEKLISPLKPPSCIDDLVTPRAPRLRAPAHTSNGMQLSKCAADVPLHVWMWIP